MTTKRADEMNVGDSIDYRSLRAVVVRAWRAGAQSPLNQHIDRLGIDIAFVDEQNNTQTARMSWPQWDAEERGLIKANRWRRIVNDGVSDGVDGYPAGTPLTHEETYLLDDQERDKIIAARLEADLSAFPVTLWGE